MTFNDLCKGSNALLHALKRRNTTTVLRLFVVLLAFCSTTSLLAQRTVTGKINDEKGDGIPSASVLIKGTNQGTVTDIDGNFSLSVPDNSTLIISSVGFTTQEVAVGKESTITIALKEGSTLGELVVVGYGTQKKKDLTGAVTSLSAENFQQGNIATFEQLANGKLAGVQITTGGGAPGAGVRIRIRGGSSLNASNDPLIVVDGVPLNSSDVSGAANPLSFLNPNDIETFTVLKDASATAIYGSRASNGVIMITTKKGKKGDALRLNFSTMLSSSSKIKTLPVLTGDEFRGLVNSKGTAAQKALLGTDNTNWQDLIYRNAFSSDNNLSATGSLAGMPLRASVGYLDQNGIVLNDKMSRISGTFGISPRLLDDNLRIDINYKGALITSQFANTGAIGSAFSFDPTQPVKGKNDAFGGYFEWLDPATKKPNTLAGKNPIALLNNRENEGTVTRHIANAAFDYAIPFIKGLRANLNAAVDISNSNGLRKVDSLQASDYARQGVDASYTQDKNNKTMQFYLNYVKEMDNHRIDVMGGYEYQDFIREGTNLDKSQRGEVKADTRYKTQNTLVSFFGRANYGFQNKYLLTATLRRDGSSRFASENRWGMFPSVALAWRLSEESGFKDLFSDLKLRVGYGVTGQQNLPTDISDYPFLARFTGAENTAQYQFGNTFFPTLRPEGYDVNIKWEETATRNLGLDFSTKNSRFGGSIDVYKRETSDLLSVIPVPAGSNLTNRILTNVGSMTNTGIELSLNLVPIRSNDFNWDVNFNITHNKNTITNLTKVPDASSSGILTGGISGGVGNTIQINSVGYPRNTFYVYKQVYNATGVPIEGLYVDVKNDSKTSPDDRYRYKQADPRIFMGFSTGVTWKDLSAGFVLRANVDNYVYNNVKANTGVFTQSSNPFISNVTPTALTTGFGNYQYFSDYYLENGSFLRMDNLSLGYDLNNILRNKRLTAKLSFVVQNVFTITEYTGIDPEIGDGIDNNFYPRPRTISLGLNVGF
jgi:TonB-dependent starch-binding outer membrane protein SusC